jgi:hypothetical protein
MATSAEVANRQIAATAVRRVESHSNILRVVRPSPAQIFGIVVCLVICAAVFSVWCAT